jgi:hypothetical protein
VSGDYTGTDEYVDGVNVASMSALASADGTWRSVRPEPAFEPKQMALMLWAAVCVTDEKPGHRHYFDATRLNRTPLLRHKLTHEPSQPF